MKTFGPYSLIKSVQGRWYIPGGLKIQKTIPMAEDPYRARESDIGWELTLISRTDGKIEDDMGEINYFDTGLRMRPPSGYYVKIIPLEELHKAGYMMMQSVSVINPEDDSNIVIPLYKFKETDDIVLPFRAVRAVLCKTEYVQPTKVANLDRNAQPGGGQNFHQLKQAQQMMALAKSMMGQSTTSLEAPKSSGNTLF